MTISIAYTIGRAVRNLMQPDNTNIALNDYIAENRPKSHIVVLSTEIIFYNFFL